MSENTTAKTGEAFNPYAPTDCSAQRFSEECLADRNFCFHKKEGKDSIWKMRGFKADIFKRVKPNGDIEIVPNDLS